MFRVFLSVDLLATDTFVREQYGKDWIDLSGIPPDQLAEQAETLISHKATAPIYLGFLDPLCMLTPYHETRLRPLLRHRHVLLLCSDPVSLPFAWKNGIDFLTIYETAECPS